MAVRSSGTAIENHGVGVKFFKIVKVTHTLEVQVNFTENESKKKKKTMAFRIYFLKPDLRGLLRHILTCTLNSTDEL